MANSGPDSNKSQFYITFRATPHLDGKHTGPSSLPSPPLPTPTHPVPSVFGRLVGGDDVLSKIERVPVDPTTNRPRKPVILKDVAIFQDPFDAYRKRLEKRLNREEEERLGQGEKARKKREREEDRTTWFGTNLEEREKQGKLELEKGGGGGVGKYVAGGPPAGAKGLGEGKRREVEVGESVGVAPKKKKSQGGFGEFSGW